MTIPAGETEAAYRKRAETAAMTMTEGPWEETITEAVYWVNEGYGGASRYETRQEAEAAARRTMMLGYGRRKDKSRVHIIETRRRVIEVSIDQLTAP